MKYVISKMKHMDAERKYVMTEMGYMNVKMKYAGFRFLDFYMN